MFNLGQGVRHTPQTLVTAPHHLGSRKNMSHRTIHHFTTNSGHTLLLSRHCNRAHSCINNSNKSIHAQNSKGGFTTSVISEIQVGSRGEEKSGINKEAQTSLQLFAIFKGKSRPSDSSEASKAPIVLDAATCTRLSLSIVFGKIARGEMKWFLVRHWRRRKWLRGKNTSGIRQYGYGGGYKQPGLMTLASHKCHNAATKVEKFQSHSGHIPAPGICKGADTRYTPIH
jgi:hypothetical protein